MLAIGIDIGGTSIKGATINEKGKILSRFSMDVNKKEKGEDEVLRLCALINLEKSKYDVKDILGVGIGMPGILDMDAGIVVSSPNLPNWDSINLKKIIYKETGLDVVLNNDANVAALGEARFGSGAKYKDIIMITLGTGVGGGIVINNQLVDGHLHMGAELGHMVVEVNGRKCGCGRRGCLEAYASATALIKETKKALKKHQNTKMHEVAKELGKIDARVAFKAAKMGDAAALKLVNEYVMYLSEGLLNYCNIFRPEAIVLSGGVANEGEYLLDMIRKYLKEHDYGMKRSPEVEILTSSLGYDSGKIGAASLLFK